VRELEQPASNPAANEPHLTWGRMNHPQMTRVCRQPESRGGHPWLSATFLFVCGFSLFSPLRAQDQQTAPPPATVPMAAEEEKPLPGDWAVELLDKLANSPNAEASEALYQATMAAGPGVVPDLEEALKDDRTAEFAAQALAYIGGEKALQMLWKLVPDPRDLNLRRFYYGALAEFDSPEATQTLLDVIRRADQEPDRTVTEAAILALTVRSDPKLLDPLREAEGQTKDVVIRLDLENAVDVIERRAKYLAAPGNKAGGSVEHAVRTYFAPALESAPPPEAAPVAPRRTSPPSTAKSSAQAPGAKAIRKPPPPKPLVDAHILNVTLSPDQTRALAKVAFEDPSATAYYDIVLQKRYGDWFVASVWLGSEVEKQPSQPEPTEPAEPDVQ
jgi:hypothetical protein